MLVRQTNVSKLAKFSCIAITVVAAVGVLTLGGAKPAKAAASTYQFPCFHYGDANYRYGQYVSGWGYHVADDVCHQAGTPVYAAAEGRVVYSARTPSSYRWGNLIMIEHYNADGSTVVSLYGHLGDNRVVGAGTVVPKGQLLGYVGPDWSAQNGNWSAHLHFGIHAGGYGAGVGSYAEWVHGYEYNFPSGWVNPQDYVSQRLAGYDYQIYSVAGGGAMYNNSGYYVIFRVRNTGAWTWQKNGPNPIKLGSVMPRDRASPFSDNGNADGWLSPTRIEMDADTAAQGVATFTAFFKSPGVAGSYNECFSLLSEGYAWIQPEKPMCVGIAVQPPGWRSEFVNQTISTNSSPTDLGGLTDADNLRPGDKRNLKVFLRNAGELPWDTTGPNPTRLGTSHPMDRPSPFATGGDGSIPTSENWPQYQRASEIDGRYDQGTGTVVSDTQITTGEIAVFSFTVTAPQQGGEYHEYFQPLVEGRTWMPDLGIHYRMRVAPEGYHYQYVTQTQTDSSIGSGESDITATLQVKNTGRESWPVGGTVRLGTDRPRDYASSLYTASNPDAWVSPTRMSSVDRNVTSSGKSTIDTGEVAEFKMRLVVQPNMAPGTYHLYVQPLAEGVTWFPENYGVFFPFTVTAPPYSYQVLHQSFSGSTTNFPRNSEMTATLAIKNTGRVSWPTSGAGAVKLGTNRPNDRASGFVTLGGSDPWESASRPSVIEGRVTNINTLATTPDSSIDPGETALFRIPLTAAPTPGTYHEYFNLVHEGVTWLPDIGLFFPLTVTAGGSQASQSRAAAPVATPTIMPTATPFGSPTPNP